MCGIVGFLRPGPLADDASRLRRMVAALRHRGPDALRGVLLDGVALGHTRLAIVDTAGGSQPMRDTRSGVVVVFNGEIFNHHELRAELTDHVFTSCSDTEVLLASYLRWGVRCVDHFNGQFAFGLWDPRDKTLVLARDPMGICPLHVVRRGTGLAFASEVKALIAGGFIDGELDDDGVREALTLWAPLTPRTVWRGVASIPPGSVWTVRDAEVTEHHAQPLPPPPREERPAASWAEELRATLQDAVNLRLRADVPVAAYLSGGLDSSVVCALAQRQLGGTLSTFSVAFADPAFDESAHQLRVATALSTRHSSTRMSARDISALLPEVVRHAEQPMLRTAPAPLMRLSRQVRDEGTRVVLTGEGADEFLLGYELYREAKVRAFWARQPSSRARPRLLQRLYPYLRIQQQGDALVRQVFGVGLDDVDAPMFSHQPRYAATQRIARFFSPTFTERARRDPVADLAAAMPASVRAGSVLERAVWLETQVLLGGYLLAAQGDRMLLANSVEGRFPFLDPRVVRLALSMPESVRLRVLDEKRVLKDVARGLVDDTVVQRPKFPYRAPVVRALVGDDVDERVRDALTPRALRDVDVFDADKVGRLIDKLSRSEQPSEVDAMALVGIVTTQLLPRELRAYRMNDDALTSRVELFT